MYEVEAYSETYDDLPLTNFPVSEDVDIERMMDITIALYPLARQYNAYYESGNLTACANLMETNPDLQLCIQNAKKYNQLRDGLIAVQRFILTEIDKLYNNVAQSAIGINDSPTDEEKSIVSYSAEKVDQLFAKYHTLRNITIPADGWSDEYPFTNTVEVEGMTSDIDIKVVGVYIPDGATLEEVKAWNKSASMLMGNDDATAEGTITFKAYKKPTVDFTVTTEGG